MQFQTILNNLVDSLPFEPLDLTLKATVILLLGTLAVRTLRRSSSAIRHALLAATLLSTMALPLLSTGLPRLEVPSFHGVFQSKTEPKPREALLDFPDESYIVSNSESIAVARVDSDSNAIATNEPAGSILIACIKGVVVGVWVLGVFFLLLATIVGEIRAHTLRIASTELQDGEWEQSLSEVTDRFKLVRNVVLLENPTISVPMTCGTIRPCIIVPKGFCGSRDERRRILLHEIAHVIRFDVALQTLGRLACAGYWFHPLAWSCLRQMHREREQACDDWVVRSGELPSEYAAQLLAIAKRKLVSQPLSATVGIVRGGNLEKRVQAMLNNDCSHASMGRLLGALLALFSVCICVTVAVIHPRPLLAETPENQPVGSTESTQDVESKSDPTNRDSYTVPINATGLALDVDGKPIPGATIYMSSQGVLWDTKRIAETVTDDKGRYTFENITLPIKRADTNSGRDHGGFILFGTAQGYGFAWRPKKWYYPNPNPNPGNTIVDAPNSDLPRRFESGDKIELNLTFPEASTIQGLVVDGDGKPIPQTKLAIWDAEEIPKDGYGSRKRGSDSRPFRIFDSDGFELLNADVPPQMWITHTDAEGRFNFTTVPKGRRFRVKVQPPGLPTRMVWFTTEPGLDDSYDGTRLYNAAEDISLTFQNTLEVPIQVVYADTGKPAPNVWVEALNNKASSYKTTDQEGRVTLGLPSGEYRLNILREYGTPYLEADSEFTLGDEAPATPIVAKLPAAGRVEIRVIDKDTGKGIKNVDLWRETPGSGRELHYTTGWEVATRIVHRDRQRTDENGIIKAIFVPGKHRIGVAWQTYPDGYQPVKPNGVEIECKAGEKVEVVLQLERRSKD